MTRENDFTNTHTEHQAVYHVHRTSAVLQTLASVSDSVSNNLMRRFRNDFSLQFCIVRKQLLILVHCACNFAFSSTLLRQRRPN